MKDEKLVIKDLLSKDLKSHIILKIEKLDISYGHVCWKIKTHKGNFLLKIAERKTDNHHFLNEIYAQRLAIESGMKVQRVLVAKEVPNSLNKNYYIQEWLPGSDAQKSISNFSGLEKQQFSWEFGETLAKLHSIKGDFFSEDLLGEKKTSSWRELVTNRLEKLLHENREVCVLDNKTIDNMEEKCNRLLQNLSDNIEPGFTHRDLYLSNVLVADNKFLNIIDFEHARFYDPLWDFVKVEAWIFRKFPELRAGFYKGYSNKFPWENEYDFRITLYEGIEFLAAFPYFGKKFPDRRMLAMFNYELQEWINIKSIKFEGEFFGK
ncbi:phosphotransferase [Rossellomorea vietnamensis]|uniref:Phosphotransferase n=1 Tax=Rossellomorea vietnamensis TaxID=218284 RepID=A0A6I6UAT8_9BACI|nr:aminoglycoside phosphotransferase family protein [Rossellomorea vietnamensis]QHE59805.1 phosphotransferase [Rossellomorea vietnamensis]